MNQFNKKFTFRRNHMILLHHYSQSVTMNGNLHQIKKYSKKNWFIGILLGSVGYHYLDLYFHQQFELIYKANETNNDIIKNCPTIQNARYFPTFYLPSAFFQMLYANFIEPDMFPCFKREAFKLKDGGQLSLDWMIRENPKELVVITHGLTGGTDCNYIKDAVDRFFDAGFDVVCINQRGVAYTKLTNSQYLNLSDPTDLREAIDYIKQRYPKANLYGLGFSIGANLILRYAGLMNDHCTFKAIISVGNPFNLLICSEDLLRPIKKIYKDAIVENFKWLLRHHMNEIQPNVEKHGIDIDKAMLAKTPQEFDEYLTRRLHGFENVSNMYHEISCFHILQNIKVPVLCIQSKKDPLSVYEAIPFDEIKNLNNMIFAMSRAGTHIEWFTGLIPRRWIMDPCIEYFRHIKSKQK